MVKCIASIFQSDSFKDNTFHRIGIPDRQMYLACVVLDRQIRLIKAVFEEAFFADGSGLLSLLSECLQILFCSQYHFSHDLLMQMHLDWAFISNATFHTMTDASPFGSTERKFTVLGTGITEAVRVVT